jgi:hypothetical protein
VAKRYENFTDR